ncbi:MAG: GyrI-like domain-containing protein [Candidatus Eisenbacteria bacterium]
MIETPQIAQTAAQKTAFIHVTIPREKIREVMGPGIGELMSTLAAQGIAPTGPWFTHHLRMVPDVFDFEISVPVERAVTPAGRVRPGELGAARVVRTVYHGAYEGLGAAWGEFDAWIEANGHATADDLWERYTVGPESGPDATTYRTELSRLLVG